MNSPRKTMRSQNGADKMNGKATNGHTNGQAEAESPELVEEDEMPPSRPLTPHEQMDIMRSIEEEDDLQTGLPSERDLEVSGTVGSLS